MFENLARHWEVVKEAYAKEKDEALAKLPVHQKDFLPAALEILEQPPSPAGRMMVWLILSFFVGSLLWSCFGRIDVVASGQGKIVPVGQTKVIQSIETGLVSGIFVKNGMEVKKGDVLIELDSTFSNADVERLAREMETAQVTVIRNEWLMESVNVLIHNSPAKNAPSAPVFSDDVSVDVQRVQSLLAQSQLNEYKAVTESLREQLNEKMSEQKVVKGSLAKLKETLPFLLEQVEGVTILEAKGTFPRFQYLEYKERLVTHQRDIEIEQDRIGQVSSTIKSIHKQIEQHKQEFQKTTIAELADATNKLVAAKQELAKATQTNKLQKITSPVDGVVQQLAMNTIGGVVRAGDPIMVMVPKEEVLQVEVNILNKDIGFVEAGQSVEVKLDAFPFTKYGVIHGEILSIDKDAVQDENLGLIYPTRISLAKNTINVNGKEVTITPGMSLTAEAKIGTRRIIEFVIAPLLRYKDESLRER